jgi:hypothetical protein
VLAGCSAKEESDDQPSMHNTVRLVVVPNRPTRLGFSSKGYREPWVRQNLPMAFLSGGRGIPPMAFLFREIYPEEDR